jgi:glutathione peroxidase
MGSKKIKWNFTKFLINAEGEPIARFGSSTKPEKIAEKITETLA